MKRHLTLYCALVTLNLFGALPQIVAPHNPNAPLTPLAVVLQPLLLVLLVAVIVGNVFAVALALLRTPVEVQLLWFALLPASIATLAMGAGVGATLVLTVLSYQQAPQLAPGNLTICALVMLGALVLASMALRRRVRAARGSFFSHPPQSAV